MPTISEVDAITDPFLQQDAGTYIPAIREINEIGPDVVLEVLDYGIQQAEVNIHRLTRNAIFAAVVGCFAIGLLLFPEPIVTKFLAGKLLLDVSIAFPPILSSVILFSYRNNEKAKHENRLLAKSRIVSYYTAQETGRIPGMFFDDVQWI